jgi:glycosyltransferase involved in cell wall biosynthesis
MSAEQIADFYAATDVYVWPSVRETPGMTFLEAQASGLPVVGGAGGGVPDVIDHGVGGFLATKRDAYSFASCLKTLLADPKLRQTMGTLAIAYVNTNHSLKAATSALNTGLALVHDD